MENKNIDKKEDEDFNKAVMGLVVLGGIIAIIFFAVNSKNKTADLQSQIQDLKNQQEQTVTDNNTEIQVLKQKVDDAKNSTQGDNLDYAKLALEWKSRIVKLTCTFNVDGYTSQGSGTLLNMSGYGLVAATNAHVVLDEQGYAPDFCVIGSIYNGLRSVGYKTPDERPGPFHTFTTNNLDFAVVNLSDTLIPPTDNGSFDTVASTDFKVCSFEDAALGDKIAILGYPWDGSQYGVTITQGILSGIDGNFYVTDAKIDHGSSGGAAILIKKDCWLGIPSAAVTGTIESYARILRSDLVFTP